MYRCEKCNVQTEPGQKLHKRVTVTRPVTHTDKYGTLTGKGVETVKEARLCGACAAPRSSPPAVSAEKESKL